MGKLDWVWKLSSVEIYKLVLDGTLHRFPSGYWSSPLNLQYARDCTKYLIEEKLKLDDAMLKEKMSQLFFKKNKLGGMLSIVFGSSPFSAIDNAYPNRFKPWEFENVPNDFWTVESGIEATKWLLKDKLNYSDNEIIQHLSYALFKKHGLSGMIHHCFDGSPFLAINNAYPDRFKPWQFQQVSANFWTRENAALATKWLFEEKLCVPRESICEIASQKLFNAHSLGGMLMVVFNGSPYEAINNAYPNEFKPWGFKSVGSLFWNKQTASMLTRKIIEEDLKLTDDVLKEKLSANFLKENGLGQLLSYFKSSTFLLIDNAYPGKFKPWEFNQVGPKFWTLENAIVATKWLIEEKLCLSDEMVKQQLSTQLFRDNKLAGMLSHVFNGSAFNAYNAAYPNKFKPWEFKVVPRNFWNPESSAEATRWLMQERLNIDTKDIRDISNLRQLFSSNGLGGMVATQFNNNPKLALKNAYPELF